MATGSRADDEAAADALVVDAKALAAAGCFAMVLEGVPEVVAAAITESLDVPTIGIGAGPACDGQVLVFHDLLGFNGHGCPSSSAATPSWADGRGGGGRLCRRRPLGGLPRRRRGLPLSRRPGSGGPGHRSVLPVG